MSWDAVILRIRGPIRPARELTESDYLPLGTLDSVAAAIRSAFPSARWNGPTYAHYLLDEYTAIVIELENVETTNSVYLSVSGSGDPIPRLLSLANANGWVVLDVQNGDFIDPENPSREGWSGYRWLVEGIERGETEER